MLYIADKYQRQVDSISSVKINAQNTEVLSDDALVDEVAEIMYDIDDEEIIELVTGYPRRQSLTKSERKLLCMCYILYHSIPYAEEIC